MGRVQATVGGGVKGLHQTVVELARLHHVIIISHMLHAKMYCLHTDRVGKIRSEVIGTK